MDFILNLFAYLSIFLFIVCIVLLIKEDFDFSGELHCAFIISWSLGIMWAIVYLVGI